MKIHINEKATFKVPFKNKEKILTQIHDLNQWNFWSPWVSLDPTAEVTCSQPINGEATVLSWEGKFCGKGTITRTYTNETSAEYNILFLTPFKSKAKTTFILHEGKDDTTEVEWIMDSSLPFFMFFFRKMFVALIKGDYRRGLRRMRDLVEKGSIPVTIEFFDTPVEIAAFNFVGTHHKMIPQHKLPETMAKSLGDIQQELSSPDNQATMGDGYCFYPKVDIVKGLFDFFDGHAFSGNKENLNQKFTVTTIESHRAIKVMLTGKYDYLEDAWAGIMMHSRGLKLKPLKTVAPYEKYIKHYGNTKNPEEFVTEIYFPIK